MERIQKEQAGRDTATSASHVAQGRLAQPPAQTGIAARIDNSPRMIAQRRQLQGIFGGVAQLGEAPGEVQQANAGSMINQAYTIQCYTYGPSTTRTVTVTGKANTRTFEECTYNSVEFLAGEAMPATGTATKAPAAWEGWLTNKKGGHNATQLHVVNRRWGGLGGAADKNIVPGTPAENSHHLHQAEVKFDECFDGAKKAKNNCKYECSVTPSYGSAVDVKGGNVDCGDPTVVAKVTAGGVSTSYPVTVGADGLTFKEGS